MATKISQATFITGTNLQDNDYIPFERVNSPIPYRLNMFGIYKYIEKFLTSSILRSKISADTSGNPNTVLVLGPQGELPTGKALMSSSISGISNNDLNNFKTPLNSYVYATGCLNAPVAESGMTIVMGTGTNVTQEYKVLTDIDRARTFIRRYNGSWSDWSELITTSNINSFFNKTIKLKNTQDSSSLEYIYPLQLENCVLNNYDFNTPANNINIMQSWRSQNGRIGHFCGIKYPRNVAYNGIIYAMNEYNVAFTTIPNYSNDGMIGGFYNYINNGDPLGVPTNPSYCQNSPWLVTIDNTTDNNFYFRATSSGYNHSDDNCFYAMCYRTHSNITNPSYIESSPIKALPRSVDYQGINAVTTVAPLYDVSYCWFESYPAGEVWIDQSDWLVIEPGTIMQFFVYSGVCYGSSQSDDQQLSVGIEIKTDNTDPLVKMRLI